LATGEPVEDSSGGGRFLTFAVGGVDIDLCPAGRIAPLVTEKVIGLKGKK
jgi:hypothetical protein